MVIELIFSPSSRCSSLFSSRWLQLSLQKSREDYALQGSACLLASPIQVLSRGWLYSFLRFRYRSLSLPHLALSRCLLIGSDRFCALANQFRSRIPRKTWLVHFRSSSLALARAATVAAYSRFSASLSTREAAHITRARIQNHGTNTICPPG